MKIVKYVKMFEIRGTSYYDINVTKISQIGILRNFSVFTAFEKKDVKAFGKNTVTF